MRHKLQQGKAMIAHGAKLVFRWRSGARRRSKSQVILTLDLETRLEVSLIGKHFLEVANIAQGEGGSVVADDEMIVRLTGLHSRQAAAEKAGLNLADFEVTKTDGTLLVARHDAHDRAK